MLFQAVMKFLSRLVEFKILVNWGMVHCDITFLTVFILTHPVNFPCGRKPERPEKTHDFRQSVDRLFSHESVARIEPTNFEVKEALALTGGGGRTTGPPTHCDFIIHKLVLNHCLNV